MFAYPEAEVVISPCAAVLLHCTGGGCVAQVMVPTDKHQRDGGICSLQGCLKVSLLTFSEWRVWEEGERGNSACVLVTNEAVVTVHIEKQNNTDLEKQMLDNNNI